MNEITIIPKSESPRKIKRIRLNPYPIHRGFKPKLVFLQDEQKYYCYSCGNYIKPSKVKEHKRK